MKYDPADGIPASCSLPGYSAEECEMRAIAESDEYKRLGREQDAAALKRLMAPPTERPS
jgi:hypothetical protein